MISRIFFPSQVDEVLRSDALLRVESCVILHVPSSSVLKHPTNKFVKKKWKEKKYTLLYYYKFHYLFIYLKI